MSYSNPHYDPKYIAKTILAIAGVFAAMKFTGGAGYVILLPIALVALSRSKIEPLVFCLVMTNALVNTNDFFAPKGFVFSFSFRLLFCIVGAYGTLLFLSTKISRLVTPLLGIFVYLIYMVIPSVQGWAPSISFMKLFLFTMTYMALAYMASKASQSHTIDMRKLRSIFLGFGIVYLVGAILLSPFPAIAYMNPESVMYSKTVVTSLYMGMNNHSQALGMAACVWTAFLMADLLFHIQRPDKLYIVLILCGFVALYKSSTRTGMGTLLVTVVFLTYLMMKIRGVNMRWKSKVISALLMIMSVGAAAAVSIPSVRDRIARFALKYDEQGNAKNFNLEQAVYTRQFLIDEEMYNFRKKPTIGWGFQVSEKVGEMAAHTKGLVLTAPVEKGVWVTAILEEGGVCGEIIYVLYAIIAFCLLYFRRAYMGVALFFLIHVANLGEFTMFSMSGSGGIWHTLTFCALVFDAKRHKANALYATPMPTPAPFPPTPSQRLPC